MVWAHTAAMNSSAWQHILSTTACGLLFLGEGPKSLLSQRGLSFHQVILLLLLELLALVPFNSVAFSPSIILFVCCCPLVLHFFTCLVSLVLHSSNKHFMTREKKRINERENLRWAHHDCSSVLCECALCPVYPVPADLEAARPEESQETGRPEQSCLSPNPSPILSVTQPPKQPPTPFAKGEVPHSVAPAPKASCE